MMILPLLTSLAALISLIHAKHFLVETENKNAEQVDAVIRALPIEAKEKHKPRSKDVKKKLALLAGYLVRNGHSLDLDFLKAFCPHLGTDMCKMFNPTKNAGGSEKEKEAINTLYEACCGRPTTKHIKNGTDYDSVGIDCMAGLGLGLSASGAVTRSRTPQDCEKWRLLRVGCDWRSKTKWGWQGPCSSTVADLPPGWRGPKDIEARKYVDIFNKPCSTPCELRDGLGNSHPRGIRYRRKSSQPPLYWCWKGGFNGWLNGEWEKCSVWAGKTTEGRDCNGLCEEDTDVGRNDYECDVGDDTLTLSDFWDQECSPRGLQADPNPHV